jgi:hypothetical protein
MFLRLSADLLIKNLRLVRTRARNTALDDVFQANLASDFAHTLSVSSSGAGGSEEGVHLFERQAFGLGEEEVDECGAAEGDDAEENVLRIVLVW